MRLNLLSVVALAFVVVTAGCGGSSKKAGAPATTSAASSSTTTATTATTTASPGATPSFANSANCAQLYSLGAKFAQAVQASSGNAEARLAAEVKAFQAMANAAPSQIRGDFQTLSGAFTAFAQAMAKARLKPGTTPTQAQLTQIEAAAKNFSTPKLRTAEQHLTAWAQANCGGAAGTTTK